MKGIKSLAFGVMTLLLQLGIGVNAQNSALFMAVTKNGNSGYISKSLDNGKTSTTVWDSEMDASSGQNRMFDLTYGDGKIVAVGNVILCSEDGGNSWSENCLYTYTGDNAFSNRNNIACVTYGDGFFVAAYPFQIIYSKDGKNWKYVRTGQLTAAEEAALKNPSGLSLEDIKKDPKLHGKRPSVGEFAPAISAGLKFPRAITYAKGKFFLTGGSGPMTGKMLKIEGDEISVEKDLAFTGNAASLNSGGLQQILWDGNNTLVAVSNSTKSAFSTDLGQTWRYMMNPANNQIWALAYHNGMWVSASPFEDIFISNNIESKWTESLKREGGRASVADMIFANGAYVLVGNDNAILTSTDGRKWEMKSQKVYGFHIKGIVAVP